ncbi:MAG: hypothetical protein [Bacteriophage sp.]|nr:MAG: hypothetical protein [Bacteriophage sp.]
MNQMDLDKAIDVVVGTLLDGISYGIAWPNIQFEANGKPYAKIDVIPATTWTASFQNKGLIFRGVYQIMLIVPLGQGVQEALTHAHDIAEQMKGVMLPDGEAKVSGLPIGITGEEVYLTSPPSVGTGFYTATGYNIPISLNYRCDSTDAQAKLAALSQEQK